MGSFSTTSIMVDTSMPHLYVFYGSQTGCAESIAKRVQSDALERHMTVALHTLNEFEKVSLGLKMSRLDEADVSASRVC
ncbi:hypothetical protein DYB28_003335 [Aphanomyces astaci]|uniref:Flavodoxin-like domain-containing protein n=1 Tax=Aphanomyces astaci TaxID=112090 RepID=A0A3L6VF35_APHAT|nr:hypothetical protein DYB35_007983 [Aphanomyces astaci]RLO07485.1 hypothetical protein DYB28_003335 [Aphanomyces astaci]